MGDRLAIGPRSPELGALVSDTARMAEIPESMLRLRALLQLPRIADETGLAETYEARAETERVADRLRELLAPFARWLRAPDPPPAHPSELRIAPVDDDLVRAVNERFHYLGSHRPGARNIGAWHGDRLAGLLSFTALDVPTICAVIPEELSPQRVQVLARVFAFDWAPRNWLSSTLARAQRELKRDDVQAFVTYVNPNMGFTAASYRSANWNLFAREHGTRYGYLDGDYITDRELVRRYGTADPTTLVAHLGDRVRFSRMRLRPLELYVLGIDRRGRGALAYQEVHDLPRP